MKAKAISVLLVLLVLASGLSIGQGSVPSNPKVVGEPVIVEPGKRGGQLNLADEKPQTLNPYGSSSFGNTATGLMHATLLEMNPVTYAIEPAVAESFKIETDGKAITLGLRDIKFSDGTAVTADDVLFTINDVLLNNDIQSDALRSLRGSMTGPDGQLFLKNAEKLEPLKVKLNLTQPVAVHVQRMLTGIVILPRHKLADKVKKLNANAAPDAFLKAWGLDAKPEEFASLGPFRVKSIDPQKGVVLERNPFYWKVDKNKVQLPYVNTISIAFLSDPIKEGLAKLQAGELDYATFSVDFANVKIKDAQELLSAAAKIGFKLVYQGPGFVTVFMTFNQDTPDEALRKVFREVRFRRAIAHLIDREQIVKEALKNLGFGRDTLLLPQSPFFDRAANARFEFNLEKAKALLDELGLKDANKDGIRELPNGKPLQIELIVRDNDEGRIATAKLLTDAFAKAGIKLVVTLLPSQQVSSRIFEKRDYQAVIVGIGVPAIFPDDFFSVFFSSGRNHFYKFSDAEGKDVPEYQKRIDQILQQQAGELDPAKRKALFIEMQKLLSENLPVIWLYSPGQFATARPTLGNTGAIVTLEATFELLETLWRKDL